MNVFFSFFILFYFIIIPKINFFFYESKIINKHTTETNTLNKWQKEILVHTIMRAVGLYSLLGITNPK